MLLFLESWKQENRPYALNLPISEKIMKPNPISIVDNSKPYN